RTTHGALLRSCSASDGFDVPVRHLRLCPVGAVGGAQTVTGVRRGRVTNMLMQVGTASRSRWSRSRYCDGVTPTISVKRELNEPSEVQPTSTQVSVTDFPRRRRA